MRKSTIISLLVSMSLSIYGQKTPNLTLEECIRLSGQNSYLLKSENLQILAGEESALLAGSSYLPRISAELGTENKFLQPYSFNQAWASIHVEWKPGELLKNTGRSARQDVETQKLEKEQRLLDVIGRSTSLYMSILQNEKQRDILNSRISFVRLHLIMTKGMWEAGISKQLDVLQTESELINLIEDSTRLDFASDKLRVELAMLVGWKDGEELTLAPVNLDSIAASGIPPLLTEELSGNPLIESINSRIKAEQFRTDEVVASQIPRLEAGAGFMTDGDPTGDGNFFGVNIGVLIPVFLGKEPLYRKNFSRLQASSLEAQKMEILRDITIHMVNIYKKLISIKELLNIQRHRLSVIDNAVKLAETNYKAGISTNLDWLAAQQDFTEIQLDIEKTKLAYTMNLIEYFLITNHVDQIEALSRQ